MVRERDNRDLGERILQGAIGAVWAIGATFGAVSVCNQFYNNSKIIDDDYIVIKKAELPWGYTKFSRFYNSEDEVEEYNIFETKTITDKNKDGIVDEIKIEKIGYSFEATREKSYEQYKKEFDDADKILRETKKRFKVE